MNENWPQSEIKYLYKLEYTKQGIYEGIILNYYINSLLFHLNFISVIGNDDDDHFLYQRNFF